jgi:hypothetical protein
MTNETCQTICLCNDSTKHTFVRVNDQFKNGTFGNHLESIKKLLVKWLQNHGQIFENNFNNSRFLDNKFEYRIKQDNTDVSKYFIRLLDKTNQEEQDTDFEYNIIQRCGPLYKIQLFDKREQKSIPSHDHVYTPPEKIVNDLFKDNKTIELPLFFCNGTIKGFKRWCNDKLQFVLPDKNTFTKKQAIKLLQSGSIRNPACANKAKSWENKLTNKKPRIDWWVSAAPHLNRNQLHITLAVPTGQIHCTIIKVTAVNSEQKYVEYEGTKYILLDLTETAD